MDFTECLRKEKGNLDFFRKELVVIRHIPVFFHCSLMRYKQDVLWFL